MNFLDGHWVLVRETAADPVGPLMDFLGYDTVNGRVYRFTPVIRREINVDASRWRVQFGSTVFFSRRQEKGQETGEEDREGRRGDVLSFLLSPVFFSSGNASRADIAKRRSSRSL
jgi:hypothetical protein